MAGQQHSTTPGPSETSATRPPAARSIQPCNFRSAGRLSNENARTLTGLHEQFARNLANALDVHLGTGVELRLLSLEQVAIETYIAGLTTTSHVFPCAVHSMQASFLIEMEIGLMLSIIDVLLGGTGAAVEQAHEFTEIDEQILDSTLTLITRELERSWQPLDMALVPGHSVKPAVARQLFPPNEKPLLLTFELGLAGISGRLKMVLPTSLSSILIRQIRTDPAKMKGGRRPLQRINLREWMMDCEVSVAADLPRVRVPISELVGLRAGSVLKLRAPVQTPARLTVEDREVFEALPVRSGGNKAAQLLSPVPDIKWR